MSPETIAALTALVTLIKGIGVLPLGGITCLCILGPWVVQAISINGLRKDQQKRDDEAMKRFEEVTRMYENNVDLVKGYQDLAGDLAGIIHLNTQTQTQLFESIRNNLYCPLNKAGGR